jgi:voltage-gated potassium channel
MWEQSESGRVRHPFEPVILIATLAMIPVLIIERDAQSDSWQAFAQVANWLIWAVFAAELVFVLCVAPAKRRALRAHWLDAAIVVVTVPLYGALLSSLRLIRLVRLMRLARAAVVVSRALQAEKRLTSASGFRFVALATVFLVIIAGAVQAEVDQGEFATFWDGVWWAVVTVTTVGYGDLYPATVAGRIVGIALMLLGIGFLAVLTATVWSRFVKADGEEETNGDSGNSPPARGRHRRAESASLTGRCTSSQRHTSSGSSSATTRVRPSRSHNWPDFVRRSVTGPSRCHANYTTARLHRGGRPLVRLPRRIDSIVS